MACLPTRTASVLLLSTVPAFAQWTQVPATNPPTTGLGSSLVPWRGDELLLFGGLGSPNEWSWDGIAWQSVTTPVSRRFGQALARNEADGSLLLFGGLDATTSTPQFDTWSHANGTWTQLTPTTVPDEQPWAMAYDPVGDAMLMVTMTKTWRFANGDWSLVAPLSVSASSYAMVSDPVHRAVWLIAAAPNGTTIYDFGIDWLLMGTSPATMTTVRAAFDAERGRVLATGPGPGGWVTLEWDGLAFTTVPAVGTAPSNGPFSPLAWHRPPGGSMRWTTAPTSPSPRTARCTTSSSARSPASSSATRPRCAAC
jgi:hypothetical protein